MTRSKINKRMGEFEKLRIDNKYLGNNPWGFAEVKRCPLNRRAPFKLILAWGEKTRRVGNCLHFYIDDYKFENVWQWPSNGLRAITNKKIKYVIAPDFSLYMDWPHAVKIWNTYRNRLITRYWQENAEKRQYIIPCVNWSNPQSWEYCFEGLPHGGAFSIARFSKDAGDWERGFIKFYERCEPETVILFGYMPEYVFRKRFTCSWIQLRKNAEVV